MAQRSKMVYLGCA